MNYNPLRYFWIAEYENGKAIPQFDPHTGKPNLFTQVDLAKVRRFGWYPFSLEFAAKVTKANGQLVIPTTNPEYTVELKPGDELVAFRRNLIRYSARSQRVKARETFYFLGVKHKKVMKIDEEGKIVDVRK